MPDPNKPASEMTLREHYIGQVLAGGTFVGATPTKAAGSAIALTDEVLRLLEEESHPRTPEGPIVDEIDQTLETVGDDVDQTKDGGAKKNP